MVGLHITYAKFQNEQNPIIPSVHVNGVRDSQKLSKEIVIQFESVVSCGCLQLDDLLSCNRWDFTLLWLH